MANPFEDFKTRYAGQDAIADKLDAAASAKMEAAYETLYNAIYKELSTAKKDVNYATLAKQNQILKQVGVELDKFKTKSGSYLMKALKKISEHGTQVAIKDMELITSEVTKESQWHYDYNRKYAEQVFKDNFSHIASQTTRISNSVKTQLQADSATIFRRAAVEGWSRKQATKELEGQIGTSMPSFAFVDNKGRQWDSKTYFNMLAHTVMSNTLNEVYANTLVNEGVDLVKVTQNGATDACRNWEGTVLSLTGATPGYPTVADAKATKEIFHPRCRHRLVAYDPDIDSVFKQVDQGGTDAQILGFDPDKYLSSGPTERALKKLSKLAVDPETGHALNPMNKPHPATMKGIELVEDLIDTWGVKAPSSKGVITLKSILSAHKTVNFDQVKEYINSPELIASGTSVGLTKINGKYVVNFGHGKIIAAQLLGGKSIEATISDFDAAYKANNALKKKAAVAAKKKLVGEGELAAKKISWAPAMTESDAKAWSAGSAIKTPIWTQTGKDAAKSIVAKGIDPKLTQHKSWQGAGGYFAITKLPAGQFGPVELKAYANVKNPFKGTTEEIEKKLDELMKNVVIPKVKLPDGKVLDMRVWTSTIDQMAAKAKAWKDAGFDSVIHTDTGVVVIFDKKNVTVVDDAPDADKAISKLPADAQKAVASIQKLYNDGMINKADLDKSLADINNFYKEGTESTPVTLDDLKALAADKNPKTVTDKTGFKTDEAALAKWALENQHPTGKNLDDVNDLPAKYKPWFYLKTPELKTAFVDKGTEYAKNLLAQKWAFKQAEEFKTLAEAVAHDQAQKQTLVELAIEKDWKKVGLQTISIDKINSMQSVVAQSLVMKMAKKFSFDKYGENGLPVVFRLPDGTYILKDGNHRVNAAILAGHKSLGFEVRQVGTLDPAIAKMEGAPKTDLSGKDVVNLVLEAAKEAQKKEQSLDKIKALNKKLVAEAKAKEAGNEPLAIVDAESMTLDGLKALAQAKTTKIIKMSGYELTEAEIAKWALNSQSPTGADQADVEQLPPKYEPWFYLKEKEAALAKAAPKKSVVLPDIKESDLSRIGPQAGSNEGGLYWHKPSGLEFYIKIPKNEEIARNEMAAISLYKLAGIDVPEMTTFRDSKGRLAVASLYKEGLDKLGNYNLDSSAEAAEAIRKKFHEGFGADAWLANWDLVGLDVDNIAMADRRLDPDGIGTAFRIDVGGSLLFRAMGDPKGDKFGKTVGELSSFLDKGLNPKTAALFKDMDQDVMLKSLKRVTEITDLDIERTIFSIFGERDEGRKLAETLIGRRNFIKTHLGELSRLKTKEDAKSKSAKALDVAKIKKNLQWAYEPPKADDYAIFNAEFSARDRYDSYVEKCLKRYPEMTREEAQAYVLYTNGKHGTLNKNLYTYEANASKNSEYAAYTRILNSAILKASNKKANASRKMGANITGRVKGNATGPWQEAKQEYYERKFDLRSDVLDKYRQRFKKGNTTTTECFYSMSQTRTTFYGNVHVYFKPKVGYAYADPFSVHRGEDEVVVPFGVNVRVQHTMDEYDHYVVYLEEI